MKILRGTFVSDGSSDQMLFPVLRWLFKANGLPPIELTRPNLGFLPQPPKGLADRVASALAHSPCDILFIHRDAEAFSLQDRSKEIARELLKKEISVPPYVKIIPVRMSEAWLLIDEPALRRVAQRPNGRIPLPMPKLNQLESLVDPKGKLIDLLVLASETQGRRLDQFRTEARIRIHQLAEFIPGFGPLRSLPSFKALETDLLAVLSDLNA